MNIKGSETAVIKYNNPKSKLDPQRIEDAVRAYREYCLKYLVRPEVKKEKGNAAKQSKDLMSVLKTDPKQYKWYLKEVECFKYLFPVASEVNKPGFKDFVPTVENFMKHRELAEKSEINLKYSSKEMLINIIDNILELDILPTNEEYQKKLEEQRAKTKRNNLPKTSDKKAGPDKNV